ncbi:hypothetical protein IPV08_16945 [Methylobacterium sp. SD274]|uniref:hypothetical protein n=1 Tax=Methylobacterium sp. SD274 TaxID=2782009 RepID=UPI001A9659B2|nr:hypothetical protein [Methylobacterium sp. SD274]MBO1021649.1 hypothetical protein [Methylobacterium sp. SD274]
MSGIIAMADASSVLMLTDGAGTNGVGHLQWIGSKVLLMPEWPGVVAVRGPSQFLWALRTHWGVEVPSFDVALARVVEDGQIVEEMHRLHRYPLTEWEIVLAGWSEERQAFEVWDVYGGPIPDFEDHPPLTLRKMVGAMGAWPAPDQDKVEALGLHLKPDKPRPVVETAGLIMLAMRASQQPDPRDPSRGHHTIGGFMQETIVTHEGMSTRIIHRWPDRIGEPINPHGGVNS